MTDWWYPADYVTLDPATLKQAEEFTARQLHNHPIAGSVKKEPIAVYQARQQAAKAALHREREDRLAKMGRQPHPARVLQIGRVRG